MKYLLELNYHRDGNGHYKIISSSVMLPECSLEREKKCLTELGKPIDTILSNVDVVVGLFKLIAAVSILNDNMSYDILFNEAYDNKDVKLLGL